MGSSGERVGGLKDDARGRVGRRRSSRGGGRSLRLTELPGGRKRSLLLSLLVYCANKNKSWVPAKDGKKRR